MAGEVAPSPSQTEKNGHWRPVRHNSVPTHKASAPFPIPRRLSSTAELRKHRLSTINEVSTSKTDDSINRLSIPPCQSLPRNHSSEHIIYIQPSLQLRAYQSVSYHSIEGGNRLDEAHWSASGLYKPQNQWTVPPITYVPTGLPTTPASTPYETCVQFVFNAVDPLEPWENPMTVDEDLPHEQIVDLLDRIEEHERTDRKLHADPSSAWLRVSEASQDLTRSLTKTMGSLKKKPTFEARLERTTHASQSPHHPPSCIPRQDSHEDPPTPRKKSISATAKEYYRKLRTWSSRRDSMTSISRSNSNSRSNSHSNSQTTINTITNHAIMNANININTTTNHAILSLTRNSTQRSGQRGEMDRHMSVDLDGPVDSQVDSQADSTAVGGSEGSVDGQCGRRDERLFLD
jgi:hypothetical protein